MLAPQEGSGPFGSSLAIEELLLFIFIELLSTLVLSEDVLLPELPEQEANTITVIGMNAFKE
jgi:hypothetical protein